MSNYPLKEVPSYGNYPLKTAGVVAFALLCLGLGLGGCAQTKSIDQAGVTEFSFGYDANGQPSVNYVSAKDFESLEAELDMTAGVGRIRASNVTGAEQTAIAGEVEKRFAEFYENATPEIQTALAELYELIKKLAGM